MTEHTKGNFRVLTAVERINTYDDDIEQSALVCDDGFDLPWIIADICEGQPGEAGDIELLSRIAEVPHECDDPECPGNINRQKLAMFDEMIIRLKICEEILRDEMYYQSANNVQEIIERAEAIK